VEGDPPTRDDVARVFRDLIDGRITREEASDWARPWVIADVDIDQATLEALEGLYGADAPTTDRPYLFGEEDFRAWLAELEQA
jgi:hypothetical protein